MPFGSDSGPALVAPGDSAELRARAQLVSTGMIDSRTREDELPPILAASQDAEVVVIAFAVRARSGAGQIAVPVAARHLVEALKVPVIGIAFGTPYLLREVPSLGTYVCAYGIQPVMQIAAINALFQQLENPSAYNADQFASSLRRIRVLLQ